MRNRILILHYLPSCPLSQIIKVKLCTPPPLYPFYNAGGAASQWWSNERMILYYKLMMVKCSLMMVKWVYDHTLISLSLTSISPYLTSILPSLLWSKPAFAHLTIIEKLHRLQCADRFFISSFSWTLTENYNIFILILIKKLVLI